MIELIPHEKRAITTVVMDFDGTLSTLRCGWENVMAPLMADYLGTDDETKQKIRRYIDESTGIQTIEQMKWLCKEALALNPDAPADPWFYKKEYNDRLMRTVAQKRENAKARPEDYQITGSRSFLQALKSRGLCLLAASGTDQEDVRKEAAALGLAEYFDEIAGALPHSENCSKEATLKRLLSESGSGDGILVIGDGPVEIRLGREAGALTLGIASNETDRRGYDEAKIRRLKNAGAHAITDCFENLNEILVWMEE